MECAMTFSSRMKSLPKSADGILGLSADLAWRKSWQPGQPPKVDTTYPPLASCVMTGYETPSCIYYALDVGQT